MSVFNEFRFTDRKPKPRAISAAVYIGNAPISDGIKMAMQQEINKAIRHCRIKTITLKAAA